MAYGAWYDDLVKAGKQTVSSTTSSIQKAGQQIVTGAQKAAGQAVQQTAQTAQKAVTGQIQTGTQAALSKIGVKPAAPAAAPTPAPAPAPAPAPRISVPQVVAQPIQAVTQTVKKNPIPTALILAAAGFGVWWFFIRKK